MADAKLAREHALALLHKLAHDDQFRARFEQDPANGLIELGVPASTVAAFPPASIAPLKLGPKAKFGALHREVTSQAVSEFICMVNPGSWFNET